MGHVKTCDGRCHNAKKPRCHCWCAGVFHGAAGEHAREAFRRALGRSELPATHEEFKDAVAQTMLFNSPVLNNALEESFITAQANRPGEKPWAE